MFIPVAIATLKVWGPGAGAIELVNALGRRLLEASRDPVQNFRQRIDIAVLRGNDLSMRALFQPLPLMGGGVFFADMSVDDIVERFILWRPYYSSAYIYATD